MKNAMSRFGLALIALSLAACGGSKHIESSTVQNVSSGGPRSFEYDARGRLRVQTDELGRRAELGYSSLGAPTETTVTNGPEVVDHVSRRFNLQDTLVGVVDHRGVATSYEVNGFRSIVRENSPDRGVSEHIYNLHGEEEDAVDARGENVLLLRDNDGALVNLYTGDEAQTFSYDQDPNGGAQAYPGQLVQQSYADGNTAYRYDGFGRVAQKSQTVSGRTPCGPVDNRDHCALEGRYGDGVCDACLMWDTDCGPPPAVDECAVNGWYGDGWCDACVNLDPDCNGQVLPADPGCWYDVPLPTLSVSYAWGAAGPETDKPVGVSYPSGLQVGLRYSPAGRVSAVELHPANDANATWPVVTDVKYTPRGEPQAWTWGSGIAYQKTYDHSSNLTAGLLSTYPLGDPNGVGPAAGVTRTVSYDGGQRIVGYAHSGTGAVTFPDQHFRYDAADRLIEARSGQDPTLYTYDSNGNRRTLVLDGHAFNVTTGAGNALATVDRLHDGQTCSGHPVELDAAGNVLYDGEHRSAFNARGRRQSTTLPSGDSITYTYDGHDQRVQKVSSALPSGRVQYLYDEAGHLLGEYLGDGTPLFEVVWLGELPLAVVTTHSVAAVGGSPAVTQELSYIYADHLATPRVIVRSSDHAIVWRWDSTDPFGSTAPNTNPSGLGAFVFDLRFPGQIADPETGLFYNHRRDYDPFLGRYLEPDPLGLAGGMNPYVYVGNQPTRLVDPHGEQGATLGLAGAGTSLSNAVDGYLAGRGMKPILDVPASTWASPTFQSSYQRTKAISSVVDLLAKILFLEDGPGGAAAGPLGLVGKAEKAAVCVGKRFNSEQQALIDMARHDERYGISREDAAAYKQLGDEIGLPVRVPEIHPGNKYGDFWHIPVGPVHHVPVL